MALRVLLADESTTIKKVIQLALQEFAVQVKSVNVGVDALDVARSFHPDIIFADVLLQKKSGYEVCFEIKRDPELQKTPVVLMWSGFLELDAKQFELSRADDKLEKPFNVETLRDLVKKYVPRLQTQQLGEFVRYPKSILNLRVESAPPPAQPMAAPPIAPSSSAETETSLPPPTKEENTAIDMLDLDPVTQNTTPDLVRQMTDETVNFDYSHEQEDGTAEHDFTALSLSTPTPKPQAPVSKSAEEPPEEVADEGPVTSTMNMTEPQITFELEDFSEPESFSVVGLHLAKPKESEEDSDSQSAVEPHQDAPSMANLPREEIVKIVRAQCQEIVEQAVWKVVPELAEQLIRREIERLLQEDT